MNKINSTILISPGKGKLFEDQRSSQCCRESIELKSVYGAYRGQGDSRTPSGSNAFGQSHIVVNRESACSYYVLYTTWPI